MIEILTLVAAVVGAVAGLVSAVGLLLVNGKVDRLTGRVDALELTMQTVLTLLADRLAVADSQRV